MQHADKPKIVDELKEMTKQKFIALQLYVYFLALK